MNTFHKLLDKLGVQRKDLKSFLIFLGGVSLTSWFLIHSSYFATVGPVVLIIVYGVFFSILWFVAGYVVFRSLLAASVGLSLIIFIGQAYCSLPKEHQTADASLMTLVGFGLIYVVSQFGYSLFRELFGDKRAKEEWRQKGMVGVFKEINGNKHSWLVIVTYGLLVSLFVWQIYAVIKPIIDGLCVYAK